MGIQRRRARSDQIVLNGDLIKSPPKADHHTTQSPIAHDQIAAHTHRENRDIRRKRAQKIGQIIGVRRLKEILRRTAHTQPRQIRQGTVFGQCAAWFWDAVHGLLLSLHDICNIHRSTAIKTRASQSIGIRPRPIARLASADYPHGRRLSRHPKSAWTSYSIVSDRKTKNLFPQTFRQCIGPCGNCTCAKADDDIARLGVGAHQLFQVVFIQKRAGVSVAMAD